MSTGFIFLLMIFLHIIDDFCLQQFSLANLKQRSFWKKNAPDDIYESDYIMALGIHAFSWAFMIMLPVAMYLSFDIEFDYFIVLLVNMVIHATVDDLKANHKKLNLVQDQTIHLMQIFFTFMYMIGGR